jgi:citrate lyase subunit beta/citryl-CoA lyase
MALRSILFVPGDSEKKIARAASSGADALILDLEDSVSPAQKPQARSLISAQLRARDAAGPQLWVRINALDTADALQDLVTITAAAPDAIILPKASGNADVIKLSHYLSALETREGIAPGHIKIIVVATETPTALFNLGSYTTATPRLAGLTWGAEDLAAAVGAHGNRDKAGLTPLYQLARSLCLAAAANAGVPPIDTACMDINDQAFIKAESEAARRDGFRAKLAIHPNQIALINQAFTPGTDEIATAQKIVAAYEADPALGTFQLDGKMIDIPHLKQARQILAAAGISQGLINAN